MNGRISRAEPLSTSAEKCSGAYGPVTRAIVRRLTIIRTPLRTPPMIELARGTATQTPPPSISACTSADATPCDASARECQYSISYCRGRAVAAAPSGDADQSGAQEPVVLEVAGLQNLRDRVEKTESAPCPGIRSSPSQQGSHRAASIHDAPRSRAAHNLQCGPLLECLLERHLHDVAHGFDARAATQRATCWHEIPQ